MRSSVSVKPHLARRILLEWHLEIGMGLKARARLLRLLRTESKRRRDHAPCHDQAWDYELVHRFPPLHPPKPRTLKHLRILRKKTRAPGRAVHSAHIAGSKMCLGMDRFVGLNYVTKIFLAPASHPLHPFPYASRPVPDEDVVHRFNVGMDPRLCGPWV